MTVFSVSQINSYLKSVITQDDNLSHFFIEGEISNFKNHYKSGHWYFSLKDEKSVINCVMFCGYAKNTKFLPSDGLKVLLRASLGIYEATGQYQLYVYDMQPYGLGSAVLAFEQLKNKLNKLGLFDKENKKPLPKFPSKIGLITAKGSAAFRDIENILKRRYPLAQVVLYPCLVQGENASTELVKGVDALNRCDDIDVIIIARGGGSQEDLSAFNDEKLAFAIFNSKIPVVSGVGHQTDFTICDLVADLRVPTPSAAAEIVVPDKDELRLNFKAIQGQMTSIIKNRVNTEYICIDNIEKKLNSFSPKNKINAIRENVDFLKNRLENIKVQNLKEKKQNLNSMCLILEKLNPISLLSRGYSLVYDKSGHLLKSVKNAQENDLIKIRMQDGFINCTVKSKGDK